MPASGLSALAETFIAENFALAPLPFRPDIAVYRPTPNSGLIAFLAEHDRADDPPYWAYAWAGGAALALYLRARPESVSGKSVLDFGAGSGLVAVAACMAGAGSVLAFEPDPLGKVALALNARANSVGIALAEADAKADIVLAGDVFYDETVAAVTLPGLQSHAARGARVLVGDPFRRNLPISQLTQVAEYQVPDVGGAELVRAGVFVLRP